VLVQKGKTVKGIDMFRPKEYGRSKTAQKAIAKTKHRVVLVEIQETYGEPGSSGVALRRALKKCGCSLEEYKMKRKARKKAAVSASRKKHDAALAGRGSKAKTKGKVSGMKVKKVDGVKRR
jgi:hypothetical protein